MKVKLILGGILLIAIGFVAGIFLTDSNWNTASAKSMEATTAATEKLNDAMGVVASASSFVAAVKQKNAAVYDEAAKGLTPQAQKDLAKLVESAEPAKLAAQ